MADAKHRRVTQLFTLRLWAERTKQGGQEMRGNLQEVSSGERRYFRDWATLVRLLAESIQINQPKDESKE